MTLPPVSGAATTTVKVGDFNAMIAALNNELATLTARVDGLEAQPPVNIEGALSRIEALEQAPAQDSTPPAAATATAPRPSGLRADRIELVYDKVTFYYGDTVVYADRVGENRWHLYAQLNYIVISPALWTYDEMFEGQPEDVYAHVVKRLQELARLKPIHDSVHDRVRRMSEGEA